MKHRTLLITGIMILIYFSTSCIAQADPAVSFTATSVENKTILTPTINSDVTEYRWTIIGKKQAYDLETGWIPYSDQGDHISILERGTYFVTITGRNTTTDLSRSFTNQVKVHIKEDYVEPVGAIIDEGEPGSRIINNLPEPLRSFLDGRNDFELLIIVLGVLSLIGMTTRRKKIKKYMELVRYK